MRPVLDAEAFAGLALAPDLIVATVEVGACRMQQAFGLRELDLCKGTLAQRGPSRRRHFGLRDFVERIEGVARGTEHHRYEAADKLQLQWNILERTALPWRFRVHPVEGEIVRDEDVF